MKTNLVTLRWSVRGRDGESEHALVAKLRRAHVWGLGAQANTWKLLRLTLRRTSPTTGEVRERDIPTRLVNRTDREELSVMAERQRQYDAAMSAVARKRRGR